MKVSLWEAAGDIPGEKNNTSHKEGKRISTRNDGGAPFEGLEPIDKDFSPPYADRHSRAQPGPPRRRTLLCRLSGAEPFPVAMVMSFSSRIAGCCL
jgi:hypothetical protein